MFTDVCPCERSQSGRICSTAPYAVVARERAISSLVMRLRLVGGIPDLLPELAQARTAAIASKYK
jgi:hypothetical protein